jgi:hypothetical protein
MVITIDLYRRGFGVLERFPSVSSQAEARRFVREYCAKRGLRITSVEICMDSCWNYLSDGTEIDWCIQEG